MIKTIVRLLVAALLLLASLAPLPAQDAEAPQRGKRPPSTPIEHLRAARAALGEIGQEALRADVSMTVVDLEKRLATLEESYLSHGTKTMSQQETASGSTRVRIGREGTWSAQVPEIDKRLGNLIDEKMPIARSADETASVKRQLSTVRRHLTAFAKGATGTSGPTR